MNKRKIFVWFIGIVLGVPVSYYGFMWMQYKLTKQHLNCSTDLHTGLAATNPASVQEHFKNQEAAYRSCRQEIDPTISNLEFIKKEKEQAKSIK